MESKPSRPTKKTVFERNKFFGTTSVAGFGLIQSSNSKVETTIWYIVIMIFSTLTIRNIILLTDEYQNQQPIASVHLEMWDGQLEDVYIGLYINLPLLYEEFYDQKNHHYPFPYIYNGSLGYDLNELIHELDSQEKIIGHNVTWPFLLISLMSRYIAVTSEMERAFLTDKELGDYRMRKVYPFIERFLNHCEQLNVTNRELIGQWFNQLMPMITRLNDRKGTNMQLQLYGVQPRTSRKLGHDDFLIEFKIGRKVALPFEMKLDVRNLTKILVYAGVFGNNISYYSDVDEWETEMTKNYEKIIQQNIKLYVGSDGLSGLESVSIDAGQYRAREVKAMYSFQSVSENCTSTTKFECYTKCVSKNIIQRCHCMPLFVSSEPSSKRPQCSLKHYELCRNKSPDFAGRRQCDRVCPDNCKQTMLSFDRTIYSQDYYTNDIILDLKPAKTSYPVFEEIYPLSSMGFWASLGGVFDFWIGASVISAVHLVVYVIKQLMYMFKKRTKTGSNMRHLLMGLRQHKEEQSQIINLLTLGITQQSKNGQRTIPEFENFGAQLEQLKRITGQQGEQIEKMSVQLQSTCEQMEKMAEQFAQQQQIMELLLKTSVPSKKSEEKTIEE